MINLETYLGQKTNFELEASVRMWLLPNSNFITDEHTSIVDITNENHTLWNLNIRKEFLYTKEFLDVCFSNKNPNWKDGSLKKLVELTRNEPL
jgi:hypothetical protein